MADAEAPGDFALDATYRAASAGDVEGPGEPLPTARVGPFLILRRLGAGGMGVVYAAYHEELDRKVAVKLVHRQGPASGGSGGHLRVLREAQAMARLSHPNVAQIYEVGEHEGQVYLAMEFIDGEALSAWQAAPGRTLSAIVDAYRQAAEGLRAAHQAGLVHRDFKPDNVLVGADGRVRVLDFGLARSGRPRAVGARSLDDRRVADLALTAPGSLAGTPAYMSPEQLRGDAVDLRSDIFALSVALWEAIYGARPFRGRTLSELAAAVLEGPRPTPPARVDVPERLARALVRGLERRPEDRWPALDPVIEALSIDPAADPSAARDARRRFFTIFALVMFSGPVAFSLFLRGEFAVTQRLFYGGAIGGTLLLLGLGLAFRRTLLRNAYHRRMLLFIAVLAVVGGAQRMLGMAQGMPLRLLAQESLFVVAAASLVGAIFFARWMLALAAIAGLGIAAGALWPGLYPGAIVGFAPAIMLTFGYFWNRDASGGG